MDDFYKTCGEHNLKITPQRIAIYNAIKENTDHPTADMVYKLIHQEYPNISFDTVNRTLTTFAEIGILKIVEGFGGPKRFDPDTSTHHHMHCRSCGQIYDYTSDIIYDVAMPKEFPDGFKIVDHRLVLEGYCKNCNKQNK